MQQKWEKYQSDWQWNLGPPTLINRRLIYQLSYPDRNIAPFNFEFTTVASGKFHQNSLWWTLYGYNIASPPPPSLGPHWPPNWNRKKNAAGDWTCDLPHYWKVLYQLSYTDRYIYITLGSIYACVEIVTTCSPPGPISLSDCKVQEIMTLRQTKKELYTVFAANSRWTMYLQNVTNILCLYHSVPKTRPSCVLS